MSDKIEPFNLFAIRYAHHAKRSSAENFINGDPHEEASPLDYFVWVAQRSDHVFVIDTGFGEEAARQRQRQLLRRPADGVKALGFAPEQIEDVIITHLHYDHAGTLDAFPRARFHIQDREMAFATGRCMCHPALRHAFAVDDVTALVRHVYAGRVAFHDGDEELAAGLSVHRIGGHTAGIQSVRVWTRRGWVVRRLGCEPPLRQYGAGPAVPDRLQRRRYVGGAPTAQPARGIAAPHRAWARSPGHAPVYGARARA